MAPLFFSQHKGGIIFYRVGGASVCGGDQNFLGWSNRGTSFFQWSKGGGDQNFLRVKEEGPKFFLQFF